MNRREFLQLGSLAPLGCLCGDYDILSPQEERPLCVVEWDQGFPTEPFTEEMIRCPFLTLGHYKLVTYERAKSEFCLESKLYRTKRYKPWIWYDQTIPWTVDGEPRIVEIVPIPAIGWDMEDAWGMYLIYFDFPEKGKNTRVSVKNVKVNDRECLIRNCAKEPQ
jgi:hypothetical protein